MTLGKIEDLIAQAREEQSRPYEGWAPVYQNEAVPQNQPITEEEDWDNEVDWWELEPPFFVNFDSLWQYDFL